MSTTVYASAGGSRYHAREDCGALLAGQDLFGGWGTLHNYRIKGTTVLAAMGDGQEPCAACLPGSRAAYYRTPAEDDYGHEPVEYDGIRGAALVCARCRQLDVYGFAREDRVRWPCASAVVLGLVPGPGLEGSTDADAR